MKKKKQHAGLFKPGVSGNPGGRPKLPEEIKKAATLTATEFVAIASRFTKLTPNELQEELKTGLLTNLEHVVATVIRRAIIDGDYKAFDLMLSRIIGKIPDNLNLTAEAGLSHLIIEAAQGKREEGN